MGVVVSLHQMQVSAERNTEDNNQLGCWVTTTTPQWKPMLKPTESTTTLTRMSVTNEKDNSNIYTNENTEELLNSHRKSCQLTEQELVFTRMEN